MRIYKVKDIIKMLEKQPQNNKVQVVSSGGIVTIIRSIEDTEDGYTDINIV